jgi:hypothetical protein
MSDIRGGLDYTGELIWQYKLEAAVFLEIATGPDRGQRNCLC